MRFPGRALSCTSQTTGLPDDQRLIAQVRLNLESVELAARSCREMSAVDGQALYDRMQAMIELLRNAQDFLVKAGQARQ